jgi:hypothetical protein
MYKSEITKTIKFDRNHDRINDKPNILDPFQLTHVFEFFTAAELWLQKSLLLYYLISS